MQSHSQVLYGSVMIECVTQCGQYLMGQREMSKQTNSQSEFNIEGRVRARKGDHAKEKARE